MNNKRNLYCSDTRYEKVYEQMQLLGIQDVSTERQIKNGTIVWKLPINDPYGDAIHVASYNTGYVRRTRTTGRSDWQLNKTKKNFEKEWPNGYKYYSIERILIPNEQDRLEYLIAFCLKNYYIGQANKLSNGDYIPKWKYDNKCNECDRDDGALQNLSVIVNNERYRII
mgnify:FL=1